jgi:CheY-like chemotaxis protein
MGATMTSQENERELWLLGLGDRTQRGATLSEYLGKAGYRSRPATMDEFGTERPLGIVLDISPFSADGWGILLKLKCNPETRSIPVLPVFLGEEGRVGGVFPVAGFFVLPADADHLMERLAVLGLIEDVEDYDLQVLVASRKGEDSVFRPVTAAGFEVVNAYTGKEAVALATINHPYMVFCALMLSDMSAFELMDRLRLYPQTRNTPFFVLMKDTMKDGERLAMSRQVGHMVRKKGLSAEEFIAHLRKRG